MSIVLKTDPRMFQECMDRVKFGPHQRFELHGDRAIDAIQDAAAAHAMQMAKAELRAKLLTCDVVGRAAIAVIDQLDMDAAANLARLMGEGNG